MSHLRSAYGALRARRPMRTWDWLCQYGAVPDGTAWDPDLYPHAERVCDAWDDPRVPIVWLKWGTRLGKSTTSHGCMIASSSQLGGDGVLAGPTKPLIERQVERIYLMAQAMDRRGGNLGLPPEHERTIHDVQFAESLITGVWSGSPTALGDLDAIRLLVTEADKFSHANTGEGDTVELARERAKNNPDAQIIVESTPELERRSRIQAGVKASTNEHRWVPCPKCHNHHLLALDQILWDKLRDGSSDKDLAYRTARWQCPSCKYEVSDDLRWTMLSRGVWAPLGCYVDRRGRVKGTPKNFYALDVGLTLGSFHSLMLTWGGLARRWLELCRSAGGIQDWTNSWEAEAWTPLRSTAEWETVRERLGSDVPRGTVPAWCQLLVLSFDLQREWPYRWPWLLVAHAPGGRRHVVDWGLAESWEECDELRQKAWPQPGKPDAQPLLVTVDSGAKTLEVYRWCNARTSLTQRVVAVKGDSRTDSGRYRPEFLGVTTRARRLASKLNIGQLLVHVPVNAWEAEIHALLEERDPQTGLTLAREADKPLLEDLCNGTQDEKGTWVKKHDNLPNDWRDCLKYSLCLAECEVEYFRRGFWPGLLPAPAAPTPPTPAPAPDAPRKPTRRVRRRVRPRRPRRRRS